MGFISTPFAILMDKGLRRAGLLNTDMVKLLGITWSTWDRYKKDPKKIPLGVFQDIVKILQLTDEEVLEVSRSWH